MDVTRRIVTGHDAAGVSVVVSDGPVPVVRDIQAAKVAFHEVWNTTAAPSPIGIVPDGEPTRRDLTVPPTVGGTKIRVVVFAPGGLDEHGLQSPVHRTESIDYGIVVEGEITLVLDDSEVTARAGDIVVQRGTNHAWANRGDTAARVVFVLVDGTFDDDLLAVLPEGVRDTLMHGDPED